MTRRRIIFISLIGLVLIGAAVVYFFGLKSRPSTVPQGPGSPELPGVSDLPLTDFKSKKAELGDALSIGTPQGSVLVKNFYKDAAEVEANIFLIKQTAEYAIVYDAEGGKFFLEFPVKPDDTLRTVAEQDLLRVLGIRERDACNLDASLITLFNIQKKTPGTSMKLSFCTNGIQSK
jgi:hypothetical protein